MTTLNDTQKIAIGAATCLAWDAVEYDYEQVALGIDLTASWGSLAHVKRMHLKEVARHLVSHLVDDGVITLVDSNRREYEVVGNLSDYEKGDWARVTDGDGVYEFLVVNVGLWSIEGASISRRVKPGRRFERAPKPVASPDPEVHKLIIDHEESGLLHEAIFDDHHMEYRYYTPGDRQGLPPRLFKDWTAVKLVPSEEED